MLTSRRSGWDSASHIGASRAVGCRQTAICPACGLEALDFGLASRAKEMRPKGQGPPVISWGYISMIEGLGSESLEDPDYDGDDSEFDRALRNNIPDERHIKLSENEALTRNHTSRGLNDASSYPIQAGLPAGTYFSGRWCFVWRTGPGAD